MHFLSAPPPPKLNRFLPDFTTGNRKRRYKSWADFRVRGFATPRGPFFRRGRGPYVNTCAHAKFGDDLPTWAPSNRGQADRRMEFNGQIRSEWTNVAHLKKRFEAPYEAARATRPPNTPNPTKNRPQDTHNTLTEQENSARASSADQLSIRWAIRPKRQNRRLRTLRSPNSRPERAPARAWCGRRRACRPGRWGRS